MKVAVLTGIWRERRRECIFGAAFLLLAGVSLVVNYSSIGRNTSQLAGGVGGFRREMLGRQRELEAAIREVQQLRQPVARLAGARQKFWPAGEGNPPQEMRKRLEQCAKAAGLRPKSLGTVQHSKPVEGLSLYEINLTADVQLAELLDFLHKLEQERPHIFWKNLSLSPDNNRAPNYLVFNGTAKILVLEDPEIPRKLWSE